MKQVIAEKLWFESVDGEKYLFSDPPTKSSVIRTTGWGHAPFELFKTQAPYQHGQTITNYRLGNRTIVVNHRQKACDFDHYWNMRDDFLDKIRISRTNPNLPICGILHRDLAYIDGTQVRRAANVFLKTPPDFSNSSVYDVGGWQENIEFEALDPVLYDPTQVSLTGIAQATYAITYTGTWETYPVVTVVGPVTNFGIRNDTTDVDVVIEKYISMYESFVINLTYDTKKITLSDGSDLVSDLTLASNLVNMNLQPAGIVTGGVNNIEFAWASGSPTVSMTYYNRYIGM